MKIAFLSFYSGQIDQGVEVATAELAKRLFDNHSVTLFQAGNKASPGVKTIILHHGGRWVEDTSHGWGRWFYLDYYSQQILWFTFKFLPFLFNDKYDVVIPTNGGWQVVICRLATWLLGKKMIVQGNAGIGRDDLWQLRLRPNVFVAISPQGSAWAKPKSWGVKNVYIPYGVNVDVFNKARSVSIPLAKPIVLCVSAFLRYKRVELLIKAMKHVQASLLLIGHGPLEKELKTLGQKLLGNGFLILTGIKHEELPGYYKSANAFSLPSASSEAFGIVFVEAMAAGLPVVSTNDLNRRKIVGDAGILIDPENTNEYAQALTQALKTDFGNKPLNRATKYNWEKIAGQYETLLKSL